MGGEEPPDGSGNGSVGEPCGSDGGRRMFGRLKIISGREVPRRCPPLGTASGSPPGNVGTVVVGRVPVPRIISLVGNPTPFVCASWSRKSRSVSARVSKRIG